MARLFTRRRAIVALLLALVVGGLGAAVGMRVVQKRGEDPGKGAPVVLEFAPADLVYVTDQPLSRWLPVSGTLQPERQATVKAKVSGEIRQIAIREGERVIAGQPIAQFDTADLDAKLAERIGALESAKAQLALATKTRAMNLKLLNEKFISQNAFDSSESSFSVAQGNVKSAEAQVRLAQIALKDAMVTAPLSGIVAKRHAQPGEKVGFDAPIVTIVDLTDLELQALVPAADVAELRVGMPVELTIDGFGEKRARGRIGRINPATEPGTRAILVYVALPNPDASLKSGMFATGRIALAASGTAPTLPSTAVRIEGGQAYVWAIVEGKLARRNVLVGRRDEDAGRVEIKTALPRDVPVLGGRFDNLKEGAPALVRASSAEQTAKAS